MPRTARAQIQQGLDDAVSATAAEARQAAAIATPPPSGTVAVQLSAVHDRPGRRHRIALRSTIDQLARDDAAARGRITVVLVPRSRPEPSSRRPRRRWAWAAAGRLFQQADARYRALLGDIRRHHYPVRLPASVWVPAPQSSAPLGSVQLAATAPALGGSPRSSPYHQLVLTAVSLDPPALPPPPGSAGQGRG